MNGTKADCPKIVLGAQLKSILKAFNFFRTRSIIRFFVRDATYLLYHGHAEERLRAVFIMSSLTANCYVIVCEV